MTFGATTSATISCYADVDTFSWTSGPLQLTTLRATCDACRVIVGSTSRREIAAVDGGLSVTVGGSSTAIIASFYASGPMPLSFSISDGGFDDHGDTLVTSTSVDAGTTITGALQFPGDIDAFSFDLAAGGHPFQLIGADVSAQLWQATGFTDTLSTADQQFVAASPGRYYVLVRGSGTYQLVVQ